jgi:hypothetical protein
VRVRRPVGHARQALRDRGADGGSGELAYDVAIEFLTAAQIEQVKQATLKVPRKNAQHRLLVADCCAALKGDVLCRARVASAWLRLNELRIPDIFEDLFPTAKKEDA